MALSAAADDAALKIAIRRTAAAHRAGAGLGTALAGERLPAAIA
jgi:hypothetical protein